MRAMQLVLKHGFKNKKEVKTRKGVNTKNGTKYSKAKNKREKQWAFAYKAREPINKDQLPPQRSY